jgi:hypothetical protein
MMMRMLAAGGLPVLSDGRRAADADNPRGYFELQAARRTAYDPAWVDGARGRVVKVTSDLLPHLPTHLAYRVVFMRRPLEQVLRSQRAMLERLDEPSRHTAEQAHRALAKHLVEVEAWLEVAAHMRALPVEYEDVLAEPTPQVVRITQFLERDLRLAAMTGAVEPALRRQR